MSRLLEGKRIIVTGTTRGIGKEMVECFAEEGADVCAVTRKSDENFITWLNSVQNKNKVIITNYCFDMTDYECMKQTIKLIGNEGAIDGLVCNAGVPHNGMLQLTSIDKIREIMEINFFAQLRLCQLVTQKMILRKKGSVVLVGSCGGLDAQKGYIAYGSSKAALMWAGTAMAKELGDYNIRVNSVAPSLTDTDQMKVRTEESIIERCSNFAIKRMVTPREVANAAAFLLSDNASMITGQILRVDGGR